MPIGIGMDNQISGPGIQVYRYITACANNFILFLLLVPASAFALAVIIFITVSMHLPWDYVELSTVDLAVFLNILRVQSQ